MKLLTVPEAAGLLGVRPTTLRDWIWRRRIPFVRIGRAVRLREADLHELIERGTVPADRKTRA